MTRINHPSPDDRAQAKAFAVERAALLTEIDWLKKELLLSRQKENNSPDFKPKFLADMSHELKTPMNAIVGLTDLLRRSPLNPEQVKLVEIIQNSGRVLLDVINDVLTFSQLEEGKFDLQTQVFELTRVVEVAAQSLSEKALEKDIYLTTFIAPEVPALMVGDPHRLRQVLVNLMTTSINTNHAGKVEVRLTCTNRGEGLVSLCSTISFSAYSATSQTNKAILETPQEFADASSDQALILEVTRRIIEYMGGTLALNDDVASFKLKLPEAQTSYEYEKSKQPVLNSRILLGNLQRQDSDLLNEYARAFGTICDVASSSAQIVELLNSAEQKGKPYNLLIIDLQNHLQILGTAALDQETLTEFTRTDLQLAIIKPYDEVNSINKLFELQIAKPLNRPINQTQFLNCLTESINYRVDSPTVESETAFEDEILTAHGFDLSQRVLVVEDNQVNREVVKLQLKTLGLKAVLVSGGMQALEELAKNHYDFILMDCQMPKMDGYATTRNIRRLEVKSGSEQYSTIIALTANTLPGEREKCLEAGMDDFISKPVTVEKLGHTLLAWQYKKSSGSTAGVPKHVCREPDGEESSQNDTIDLLAIKSQLVTTYGEASGQSIFDLFCSSTPDLLQKMETACAAKDWTALIKTAHELKGQCSVVHANKLALMCRELEQAARSEKRDAIEAVLDKLQASYQKAVEAEQLPGSSPG